MLYKLNNIKTTLNQYKHYCISCYEYSKSKEVQFYQFYLRTRLFIEYCNRFQHFLYVFQNEKVFVESVVLDRNMGDQTRCFIVNLYICGANQKTINDLYNYAINYEKITNKSVSSHHFLFDSPQYIRERLVNKLITHKNFKTNLSMSIALLD